ncbi:response regulator [Sulfurimonas microaerophilic]|uniref:response regulator n=1 Tax=Sulfurimonas microaerophilic TaxID=3058392 RepID=UPI00271476F4|nr:response regulator [Sulfurimonas sp. hsl 1-7]
METMMKTILTFSKNLRLLYIEDNEQSRTFTLELLTRFFDDIIVAKDGFEGLQKVQENFIDLILTDINMPNLDGIKMTLQIKSMNKNIKVFALTAHNEDDIKESSYNAGIDVYLEKPLRLNQFIEAIYTFVTENNNLSDVENGK